MEVKAFEEFKNKSQNSLERLKQELQSIRTNRPTPALIEGLKVDYYGQKLLLKQLGSIGVELPRDLVIHVWDKEAIQAVVKAIESSGLGLSLTIQGNVLRVSLPELTLERREELTRYVKKIVENYRIQIRHFRDEANKIIQKAAEDRALSEDEKFKSKEKIQEETDKINEEIEELLSNKIKEIMS